MQFLVNLDVDDLGKAIAFYSAAFDLRVGRRFGSGAAEMLGGPAPIYLLAHRPVRSATASASCSLSAGAMTR